MSLSDWIASRHVKFLEAELSRLHTQHASEIKSLREGHATELQYARSEIARLQQEIITLRLYLNSQAQPAVAQEDLETLKDVAEGKVVPMGTPWQRILAREIARQDAAAAVKHTQPVPAEEQKESGAN